MIEIYTVMPEHDGDEPWISEISVPSDDLGFARTMWGLARDDEVKVRDGEYRGPWGEPFTYDEKRESYKRLTALDLVRNTDVFQDARNGEQETVLTRDEPSPLLEIAFMGLIRGIELTTRRTESPEAAQLHQAQLNRHIAHYLITRETHEQRQAARHTR